MGSSSSSSASSQLGLSQLAYSAGVVESVPSVYKPSSAAPGAASAYSQPSAVSGAAPYGSTLHYPTTMGPQTMHPNYPGAQTTQGVYSAYSVAEQAGFSNTPPASYGAMATQAPTAFSGASKPYGSVADKSSGPFPASVLSQVYESSAMGNAYPNHHHPGAGLQMGYQSTGGAMYLGPNQGGAAAAAAAVGFSYEGLAAVSSSAYQNPANLYRAAGQMSTNVTNDYQSGISDSVPRGAQAVANTAPQSSAPGKLGDGLSKLTVKDSSGSVISQSYESSAVSTTTPSSLTSAATPANASAAGIVISSAANSTLKTMTVATTKSTAASEWEGGGGFLSRNIVSGIVSVVANMVQLLIGVNCGVL